LYGSLRVVKAFLAVLRSALTMLASPKDRCHQMKILYTRRADHTLPKLNCFQARVAEYGRAGFAVTAGITAQIGGAICDVKLGAPVFSFLRVCLTSSDCRE
jgi:hypothetical protein